MTVNYNKFLVGLIVVLTLNHSLITYFFSGTPLVAWKQVLSFLFVPYILIIFTQFIRRNSVNYFGLMLLLIFFLWIYHIGFLFMDPSYLRGFITFTSLLILAVSLSKIVPKVDDKSLVDIAKLSLIYVCLGVVVDSQFQIFYFMSHNYSSDLSDLYGYRPTFTLGSSSLLAYVVTSLFLLIFYLSERMEVSQPMAGFIIISLSALWLSGSRGSILMFCAALCIIYRKNVFRLLGVAFLGVLIVIFSPGNLNRISSTFSLLDPGNLTRFYYWDYFLNNYNEMGSILGRGIGYLSSESNIFETGHFESTFISLYVEVGILGILLVYLVFPLILIRSSVNSGIKLFLVFVLIHSVVVPVVYNFIQIIFCVLTYSALKEKSYR